MKKHIFVLSLLLSLVVSTTSCTSKKVDADASQEDTDLTDDIASEAAGENTEESPTEENNEIADLDEDAGEASEPAEGTETAKADEGSSPEELSGLSDDAAETPAEAPAETTDVAQDATTQESTETSAEPSESAVAMDTGAVSDETQGLSEETVPAPAPVIPLQKVATAPYTKAGVLVNAVYIARDGDTTESVSQKIFGRDKSEELKAVNPTLARRSMKVGDKVYYNSPQRPEDNSEIKTYYEDMGLAPEVYLSQAGDNIRTVAKNLLGHSDSWKEIWSTNAEVESKAELPEGTRLRYWSTPAATMPPVAAATQTPAPPTDEMAPPPPTPDLAAQGQTQPYDASMDTPPPPPAEEVAPPPPVQAMEAAPPVPPPPASEMTPPPPATATAMGEESPANMEDPDQMMALGAGAILLFAAIALFIIIRKKRSRRAGIDFQTAPHTNIE